MTDVVEIMAKACFDAEWNGVDGKPDFEDERGYWIDCAQAALTALEAAGYVVVEKDRAMLAASGKQEGA